MLVLELGHKRLAEIIMEVPVLDLTGHAAIPGLAPLTTEVGWFAAQDAPWRKLVRDDTHLRMTQNCDVTGKGCNIRDVVV